MKKTDMKARKIREELLVSTLQDSGILAPLLAAAIAQIEQQEQEQKKTSANSTSEQSQDPLLVRYREMFPGLSDEELEELAQVT